MSGTTITAAVSKPACIYIRQSDQGFGDDADGGFIRHSSQLRFGIAAQMRIVMESPIPAAVTQSRACDRS
jgi:hypothetical protein